MITIEDVTLRVIDALNAARTPHMLVGSFASNVYGIPRSTKDADFVLQLHVDLDALNVMSVQHGKLDLQYIESWCRQHGTLALMEEIRRSVPEI